jgi:hypothetical protein
VRPGTLPIALTGVLLIGGCTAEDPGVDETATADVATSRPDTPLTLVADPDRVAAASSASRALFDSSEVVVLARDGDLRGELIGASAAVGLGVPLLLEPGEDGAADALTGELDRLGVTTVLAVGEADGHSAGGQPAGGGDRRDVIAVPADPGAVTAVSGLELEDADPVPASGEAAAVAALDPAAPAALRPEDAPAAASSRRTEEDARLPEVRRADPLTGTLVLATGDADATAGIATARAAGARVQLTRGETDPRGSADVVTALSEDAPDAVVALGAQFAAEAGLDWKMETAGTGIQLPGGGQLMFPGRTLVALYGAPGTPALGVLGEQDLAASIQRAKDHAAPYEGLVDTTVVPTFEIIATVASSAAGPDGNYSAESDVEALRPWVEAAGKAGLYVVLDLQPGRTDFVTQAERYRSLLELPHVGLALDPEWRLGPGEMHLTQIGHVGIDEVNQVVTWLADLTREKALPQKLLLLHQFKLAMIPGREQLDTSRDELAVLIHADGQGSQGDKQATWRALHENAPAGVSWGWKNFYDEDAPMLTPEQTVAQVDPTPQLVSYQ